MASSAVVWTTSLRAIPERGRYQSTMKLNMPVIELAAIVASMGSN